jgi:hypothetical protein
VAAVSVSHLGDERPSAHLLPGAIIVPRHHPSKRRLVIASCLFGIFLLAVTGVGVYGLITGPGPSPAVTDKEQPQPEIGTPSPRPQSWQDLPSLPMTSDPIRYATTVAEAVFTWDTTSGLSPREYTNVVLADADPSGVEASGLLTDLSLYMPDDDTWRGLREHETAQSITIDTAHIPDSWPRIKQEAGERLAEGTTAVTIEGTRHRSGVWAGRPANANHDVAFTVFVGCPPMFDRCHLLRLSQLDNPLR